MSEILDLVVTLASPPDGAPPDTLASFRLELSTDEGDFSTESAFLTDLFSKEERENLRWYLEEYWLWPYEHFLRACV